MSTAQKEVEGCAPSTHCGCQHICAVAGTDSHHGAVFATHTPLHEPLHRATACEYARTKCVSTGSGSFGRVAVLASAH